MRISDWSSDVCSSDLAIVSPVARKGSRYDGASHPINGTKRRRGTTRTSWEPISARGGSRSVSWAAKRKLWKGGVAGSMLMMLSACDAAPIEPPLADKLSIARGEAAARRLGCGACHDIPGIDWPKGRVGPPLAGFGDRALVAGRFPNHLPLLADFVRDAPSRSE